MDANKQYLTTKIDPILEPLITQVLLEKPPELIDYILHFLEKMQKKHTKPVQKKAPITSDHKAEQSQSIERPNDSEKASDSVFVPHVYEKTADEKEKLRRILRNITMFKSISERNLEVTIDSMKKQTFDNGVTVIQEGDDGDAFYVIESGTLNCLKNTGDNQKLVKTYNKNEAFGEYALLYDTPRAATLVSKSELILWSLDADTFKQVLRSEILYLNFKLLEQREKSTKNL